MGDNETITITYSLRFGNDVEKRFHIVIDRQSMEIMKPQRNEFPEWTLLSNHKCGICPLDSDKHKYCPAAISIIGIVDEFSDVISYEMVETRVETEERTCSRKGAAQEALSSVIGACMAASGCPILKKLQPMVRFHLPFASIEETEYRVLSMYMLAQYFVHKNNKTPDLEFKGLLKIYNDIRNVNRHFVKRLRVIVEKDSNLNALITLDCFAQSFDSPIKSIDSSVLSDCENLFEPYL
jgi:hypothetical protein